MNLHGLQDLRDNVAANAPHEMEWLDGVDEVALVRMKFPLANTVMGQHSHPYDHYTYLSKKTRVWQDDFLLGDLQGPVVIKKHTRHKFMTLEPDTEILCIQNTHGKGIEIE